MARLRYVLTIALLHLAGLAAGFLANFANIPLAWMIGPMLLTGAITLWLDTPRPPRALRATGQMIVGGAIGLYVTPDAVERILANLVPIALSAVLITIAGCIIGLGQFRLTPAHRATAIFSCVPGGPVEMAILAGQNGGDPGRAAFAQTIRIISIIVLFPPLLIVGAEDFTAPTMQLGTAELGPVLILLGLSLAAGIGGIYVRMINPFFLAPLIVVGLLAGFVGMPLSAYPDPVVAGAQVLLGVSLGSMLRRDALSWGGRFLLETLATTALLLAVCIGLAEAWAALFGLRFATMMLANAPGAITEMSITAKALRLDVSLIVAFQIVRVVFSMLLIPLIYRKILVRI